jgi:hypothetical protein
MPSIIDDTKIVITKLEAGRRQLRTAIRFWFEDGDPVAIHTLVAATYEILDTLAKRPHFGIMSLFGYRADLFGSHAPVRWAVDLRAMTVSLHGPLQSQTVVANPRLILVRT